jgi:hypothetical protein
MPEPGDIMAHLPVDQIAGKLGTDKDTALQVIQAALPSLLAGMQHNAQTPDGAAALHQALARHDNGLLDGGVDVDAVDTADGSKIVSHVLGDRQDTLVSQLNAATAPDVDLGGLVRKALPILAPIVMSYLAKKLAGGSGGTGGLPGAGAGSGGGLGDLLGGILGGAGGGSGQGGILGGGLGDLLGGLLGGGRK